MFQRQTGFRHREVDTMRNRALAVFAATALVCLLPAAGSALTPFFQDFELLIQPDPGALAGDGWLVFGNVFDPEGGYLYGYGPFPAPNHNLAFSQIVLDQGGPEQGLQQLVVFNDYESAEHGAGNTVESNVFQEQTIEAGNVGQTWIFRFNAKMGNLEGGSTAAAFIKTLDPGAGYALTNFLTVDMTTIPETWQGYLLYIRIDESLAGQILQFGFMNTATSYEGSGIFYDNVDFGEHIVGVPDGLAAAGATLRQNYPNPFNPMTRIEFALERPGNVDISVFDVAGRRIAVLHRGQMGAGEHHVTWDGKTDRGGPAPAGQYFYVLETATSRVSRRMVLLK
jgi:hypothetical protein